MRNPRILTPRDALLRARISPRSAPKPSRHVGLEGWIRWGLIDRAGREVKGGEQHNLILDGFLDAIAARTGYGAFYATSNPQRPTMRHFLTHFAVGTGSTEPDVTDTALANEIARTTTQTADSSSRPANGVYEITLEREFDFNNANGNLTEFGLSTGASDDILVRELFRDGQGNPITVTKTSDFKLRIAYTLTITLTPVVATPASFDITGIGTINGDHFWVGGTNADQAIDLRVFSQLIAGQGFGTSTSSGVLNAALTSSVISGYTFNSGISPSTNYATTIAPDLYTPGSHSRKIATAVFGTNTANMSEVKALAVRIGGGTGWAFVIDEADWFEKDNLHQLAMTDFLTVTWARG